VNERAGASPCGPVTRDAFERVAGQLPRHVQAASEVAALDGIYLDLHGAAVAECSQQPEVDLLTRIGRHCGPAVWGYGLSPPRAPEVPLLFPISHRGCF
jgi:microcystin degradation protein MlrC